MSTTTAPRLKTKYNDEVKGALMEQLGLANPMQVPRLEKIVINMATTGPLSPGRERTALALGNWRILATLVSRVERLAGERLGTEPRWQSSARRPLAPLRQDPTAPVVSHSGVS